MRSNRQKCARSPPNSEVSNFFLSSIFTPGSRFALSSAEWSLIFTEIFKPGISRHLFHFVFFFLQFLHTWLLKLSRVNLLCLEIYLSLSAYYFFPEIVTFLFIFLSWYVVAQGMQYVTEKAKFRCECLFWSNLYRFRVVLIDVKVL